MLAGRFLGTTNLNFHRFGMGYRAPGPLQLSRRADIWLPLHLLLQAKEATSTTDDDKTGTTPLYGQIMDQGSTGSCTAHSTVKAAKISLEGASVPVSSLTGGQQDFSPRVTYAETRQIERGASALLGEPLPSLADGGAMPDDCITAVADLGLTGMGAAQEGRYSDVSSSNVNEEVTLAEEERTVLAVGAYDVDLAGTSRIDELKAAVRAKIGMTTALFVDTQNVMAWDPSRGPVQKIDLRDPQGGGHQVAGPCYFYTDPKLGLVWGFGNSWNVGWGQNGFLEITDRCLMTSIDAVIAYDIKIKEAA